MHRTPVTLLLTFLLSMVLGGCSTDSTQGAAEGAVGGAAVGAVGGIVSALVFGGDVGDAAARGAVWGGSTGAVSGGIQGAQVADQKRQAEKQQQQAQLDKLRKEIGDDAYLGLEALADCKHTVAIAYAETAQGDANDEHALAGLWVEILAIAEQGDQEKARAMIPELVEKDDKLNSAEQASTLLQEVMNELEEIREQSGQSRTCT